MSEEHKKLRRRRLSECITRNEDLLVRVLSYSKARFLLGRAVFVNRFWKTIASQDSLWKDLTQKRWKGMRMESLWLSNVSPDTMWVDMYKESLGQIRRMLPVFAMHSRLRRGMGMGLVGFKFTLYTYLEIFTHVYEQNFFEPRYKWLSQRIKSDNPETGSSRDEFDPNVFENSNDQLFCFCTHRPSEGAIAWICRACHLNIRRDGGSDFIALPLAKCILKRVWTEEVPQEITGAGIRAPPLMVCVCEELPFQDSSRSEKSEEEEEEEERSESWGARVPDIIRRRQLEDRLMGMLSVMQRAGAESMEGEDVMNFLHRLLGIEEEEEEEEEED